MLLRFSTQSIYKKTGKFLVSKSTAADAIKNVQYIYDPYTLNGANEQPHPAPTVRTRDGKALL